MNLKIRQPTLHPNTCQIWLDGQEITNGLTGLTVNWDVDEVTNAELRILVDELDVDADTLAVLQAHVEGKDAPTNGNGNGHRAEGTVAVRVTADTRQFARAIRRASNSLDLLERKAAALEEAAQDPNTKVGDG